MSRPHPHGAARAFARTRPERELRQDWLAALELAPTAGRDALAMAEGADAAPSGQPGQVLTRLAVALRDLAPVNFPAQGFAPRVLAATFLMTARAFVQPTGNPAEARTVLAPALVAGSGHLDALLNTLRRHESAAWRAQTGERED